MPARPWCRSSSTHAPTCWPRRGKAGLTTIKHSCARHVLCTHVRCTRHNGQRTDLRGVLQHLIACSQEPQDEGEHPLALNSRHHALSNSHCQLKLKTALIAHHVAHTGRDQHRHAALPTQRTHNPSTRAIDRCACRGQLRCRTIWTACAAQRRVLERLSVHFRENTCQSQIEMVVGADDVH
jgi:hypothetical protein